MAKYWCKTCSTFVDENTKLSHESSSKHKSNTSKIIRDLQSKQREEQKLNKLVDAELKRINNELDESNGKKEAKKGPPKFTIKKVTDSNSEKEKTPALNKWETVKTSSEPEEVVEGKNNLPTGVSKKKITASEMEMKGWDLMNEKQLQLSDEDDDEGPKPTLKIKKRKIMNNKKKT